MDHKFEGYLNGISELQLNFISGVLKKQGFGDGTVVIEPVGKAGDNYGSDVRRIIAHKNGESYKMIAKIKLPLNDASAMLDVTAAAFYNENLIYTEVLPKYTELEKQALIPESDRLVYANYFGALLEEPNVMIMLEDLQGAGYATLDRNKPLPDDAIKSLLKSIASLHAYSFVLKHREPETFAAIKNKLINIWEIMSQNEEMITMFKNIESDILIAMDDEKYKDLIRGKVSKVADIISVINKLDTESDYYVIQHGDAWTNNVLFKLQDEEIVSCCMIDYQVSRAASPASDIIYGIFNCSDYESRARRFHHWISYYYLNLDKTLAHFGLKANLVYSRENLDADLKRYGIATIAITAFGSTILARDNDEVAKIKDELGDEKDFFKMIEANKIINSSTSTLSKFKARVKGIIDSCIELELVQLSTTIWT